MKRILLLVLFYFTLVNIISGEGWTKKAGSGYYAVDYRFLSSTKYHDSNGDNIEITGIKDFAFNLYSEYGITNELTLNVNFPFYKVLDREDDDCSECKEDNSGVGDLDIGFRYKLKSIGKTSIATSLLFGIPINSDDLYGNGKKLALGDGEFNQVIGIGVGHSLYPLPAYLSGGIKFNNRNEGYSDQIRVGVEGGYKFHKKLLLNLRLSYLKSLKNGDKKVFDNLIPIHANDQEFSSVKIGGFYNFYKNYGLATTAVFGLSAKNILSAPVYSIGFYIR